MRRNAAAMLLAGLLTSGSLAPPYAACAHAQAASAFEQVPRAQPPHDPHRAAYLCALAGAGLIAGSFPIADEADRRYGRYLRETDTSRIEDRYRSTVRMDRLASGALLGGEALLASALYLRFVRHKSAQRLSLTVEPSACAVSWRF